MNTLTNSQSSLLSATTDRNLIDALRGSQLAVVSDLHIRSGEDPRAQLLIDLIHHCRLGGVKQFFLLGDVFEFCFPRHSLHIRQFAKIGEALSQLAATDCRIIFFEGNHEFEITHLPWSGVEWVSEGSLELDLNGFGKLKLAHGDLVYADQKYLWFRKVYKSRFIKFAASFIPATWLNAYAMQHAKISRAGDAYREIDYAAFSVAVSNWLGRADIGIVGHFHVPFNEPLPQLAAQGLPGKILSVHSWDKPNFLLFKDGIILRGERQEQRWNLSVAQSSNYLPELAKAKRLS